MKYLILIFAVALAGGLSAAETSGQNISEILKEMSTHLNKAQKKMDDMEKQRVKPVSQDSKKLIEERRELLKELAVKTKAMDSAEDDAEKKVRSQEVEDLILKVGNTGSDFLEIQKEEINFRHKQLGHIEQALAGVVNRMEQLMN